MGIPTNHQALKAWVDDVAALTKPDRIYWCDGSAEEYDRLCQLLVDNGTFARLSDAKRPDSYLALSDPADVARVEDAHLHLLRPAGTMPGRRTTGAIRRKCARPLTSLFDGSMRGRTMYVVPFSMGPLGSPISQRSACS